MLAAAYLLWLLQRTAFGTPSDEFADDPHIHDTVMTEWVAWVPMLILILLLGFVPGIVFDVTNGPASAVGQVFEALGGATENAGG